MSRTRPIQTGSHCPPAKRVARRKVLGSASQRPTEMAARFAVVGVGWITIGLALLVWSVVSPDETTQWTALHCLFLGGVSQLVIGFGQFFSCAFLATTPPHRRLTLGQLVVWNAGVVGVVIAVPRGHSELAYGGAVLIVAALVLFLLGMAGMERRSLRPGGLAVIWYQAATVSLVVGALVGVAMTTDRYWTHGSLVDAHVTLNVAGWLGGAILGTEQTFFPSLTHTRLAHPMLQLPVFGAWFIGVIALACGSAFAQSALVTVGWVALFVAVLIFGANISASWRASRRPRPPAVHLVATGYVFGVAGIGAMAVFGVGSSSALPTSHQTLLAAVLLAGWIGLTVAGSLVHLLGVLIRVQTGFARPAAVNRSVIGAICMAAALSITAIVVGGSLGRVDVVTSGEVGLAVVGLVLMVMIGALAGRLAAVVLDLRRSQRAD